MNKIKTKEKSQHQVDFEIIDLTNMTLFETIQTVINNSVTYKSKCKNLKYKSNIPNIEKVLTEIPLTTAIEFV